MKIFVCCLWSLMVRCVFGAEAPPDLLNFTHQEKDLSDQPAILRNGKFKGDHLEIDVLLTAEGQLNGDQKLDGVAVCFLNAGGSGNFRQLCLLFNVDGKMTHVDTAHLGDRIKIQSVIIADGMILVEYLDRGPEDAMAVAPYILTTRRFKVQGKKLVNVG